MGAADRLHARLGQAEMPYFALANEVAHGAGHVLDRNFGIDAVLVEEIDRIDP
jgi:hypothetical protein